MLEWWASFDRDMNVSKKYDPLMKSQVPIGYPFWLSWRRAMLIVIGFDAEKRIIADREFQLKTTWEWNIKAYYEETE